MAWFASTTTIISKSTIESQNCPYGSHRDLLNFNNYCKKNCLHKVSLLYMILWWTGMAIGVLGGHLLM